MHPLIKSAARCISSCGPLGYLPASGTWASLLGMLAWLTFPQLHSNIALIFIVLIALVSLHFAQLDEKDPSWVVIDEVVGMFFALYALPLNWRGALMAFGLFRFNDIIKWGPIKKVEQLPGYWGILADDILAGLIAVLILKIVMLYVS